jgi:hypothetical protein
MEKPKLKNILFKLPEEMHNKFLAHCREEDDTMSRKLRRYIADCIKE